MPTQHTSSLNAQAVAHATEPLVTVVAWQAILVMDVSAQAAPMIARAMVSARARHTLYQMWQRFKQLLLTLRLTPTTSTLVLMQGRHMAASVTLDFVVQTARSVSARQAVIL